MSVPPSSLRRPIVVAALGFVAFALLAARFSPNWLAFAGSVREAYAGAGTPAERDALERAVFSGHSERGLHVLRQARHPAVEIENSVHKIVRWRLLVPVTAHLLGFPDWLTLGFAHLGCAALVLALVRIGLGGAAPPGRSLLEALSLALVAGATAPFFTSMGWVGYYDSLLALALLGVAFAPSRGVVLFACLAAPWIDERFVLGLPLALCVRGILDPAAVRSPGTWLRREALLPVIVVAAYALVRLQLGGTGGSHTVAGYLQEFVFSERFPLSQRLLGAWAGLRVGWLLVILAIAGTWGATRTSARWPAWLLVAGVILTAMVGLVTALDMSRSMALLLPVVPLGWHFARQQEWWRAWRLGPVTAAAALALPAAQVVSNHSIPVDSVWTYSLPLMTAENNIGRLYAMGDGVPVDGLRAARWLRRPAEQGNGFAQNSLGLLHAMGKGVKLDGAEAARWFRRAADQGVAVAMENLGLLYANGVDVAVDLVQAHAWFSLAVAHGHATSAEKLRLIESRLTPPDLERAREWAQQWQAAHGMGPRPKLR